MRVTVLIDNISRCPTLLEEWGLALSIQHEGKHYLLDTGAGPSFAQNAESLGIPLADVDVGVLSHAHYDHADGMETFFAQNKTAPFYLQTGAEENCYGIKDAGKDYIGIQPGLLDTFVARIRYAEKKQNLAPGVWLLGHSTPGLAAQGKKFRMYRKEESSWVYDDFRHEQSLIFDTAQGLILFNSCCHGGADVIVREALTAFPGKKVYAIVGGFHLFESTDEEVRAFGQRLLDTGVEQVVTGHCTGQEAFDVLKTLLGERLTQMESGLTLTFGSEAC